MLIIEYSYKIKWTLLTRIEYIRNFKLQIKINFNNLIKTNLSQYETGKNPDVQTGIF